MIRIYKRKEFLFLITKKRNSFLILRKKNRNSQNQNECHSPYGSLSKNPNICRNGYVSSGRRKSLKFLTN